MVPGALRNVAFRHLFVLILMLCVIGMNVAKAQFLNVLGGPSVGRYRGVVAAAVSPDGKLFATQAEQEVIVFEMKDGHERFTIRNAQLLGDTGFSPNGTLLLIIHDNKPELVDTVDGKTIRILKAATTRVSRDGKFRTSVGMFTTAAFSPDGKWIALENGTLYHMFLDLYNVETGQQTRELLNNVDGVGSQLIFAADSSRLLAVRISESFLIETATGKEVWRWSHEMRRAWFAPDGKNDSIYYIVNGTLRMAHAGDTATTSAGSTITSEQDLINSRMVKVGSTDWIAILKGEDVLIHDLKGQRLTTMQGNGRDRATCVAFSADGRMAVVGRTNGKADIWRL